MNEVNDRRISAIEELKLLSSIIGRIENAIHQRQGWLLTLITGLTLVLLKDDPIINKGQFAIISLLITIIFYIADIVQRVPVHLAVGRSREVESFLSGKQADYDGPRISDTLGQGSGIKDCMSICFRVRVWAPYGGLIILISIIYFYA